MMTMMSLTITIYLVHLRMDLTANLMTSQKMHLTISLMMNMVMMNLKIHPTTNVLMNLTMHPKMNMILVILILNMSHHKVRECLASQPFSEVAMEASMLVARSICSAAGCSRVSEINLSLCLLKYCDWLSILGTVAR